MNLTTMPRPATRARDTAAVMMKACVYGGPGKKTLEQRPKPEITAPTDAIVRIVKTTICGTDLHILKGDVPTCTPGAHPRSRGGRHRRGGRGWGHELQARLARPDLLHPLVWQVHVLPPPHVLALHHGRLDPRQRHRCHG